MTSSIELRVSPRAERDIAAILNYTRKTWGTGQEDTYALIIRNAFGRIQAFPEIGRRVSGVGCPSIGPRFANSSSNTTPSSTVTGAIPSSFSASSIPGGDGADAP